MSKIILTWAGWCLWEGISFKAQQQWHNVVKTDVHPSADITKLDITSQSEVSDFFSTYTVSDDSSNILINNAWLYLWESVEYSLAQKQAVINVNVIGTVLMTQSFIAWLLENDMQWTIINISSIAGIQWWSDKVYAKTKKAILQLTDILVRDEYPRVQAYSIAPSLIEWTSMETKVPDHALELYEWNKSSIAWVSKTIVDVITHPQDYKNWSIVQC